MKLRIVSFVIGWVLIFEAAFFLLPIICGLIYGETFEVSRYVVSAVITFICGFILKGKRLENLTDQLYIREGFVSVALAWFFLSIFGAIPFWLTGEIPSFVDAVFETASGLTTTGASILTDVEALSHTSLFWRSFTHWIGGMGVFVFIMAVLPMAGARNINLMRAESPGPSVGKFVPKMRDTAMLLYVIYIAFTVICFVCYLLGGMSPFEAITMTFGTVGTGGFGIYANSAGSFTPLQINLMTTFMVLAGVNYSVYFCLIIRNFKEIFSFEEVRLYFLMFFGFSGIIAWNIRPLYHSVSESARHAAFQVASIITTSGFSTVDFDRWPEVSKNILIFLMITGACAGSTAGGFKLSRVVILVKGIGREIRSIIHPEQVRKLTLDGRALSAEMLRTTYAYTAIYSLVLILSVFLVSVDNFDFTTNFTGVLATLNNIGPGLAGVGPASNFSAYSFFSKCVFIFDMLAGRLELYPILILFMPTTWRKY